MWCGKLYVIFSLLCCLCITSASDCPDFKCSEVTRCRGELYETYFYLEDKTKCSGCKKCVTDVFAGMTCPPMACPMWKLPRSCKPVFYSLLMDYKGNECSACDTYHCTGKV